MVHLRCRLRGFAGLGTRNVPRGGCGQYSSRFLAIIIPPARKNKVIAVIVIASMLASSALTLLEDFIPLSSGMRILILTVVIAGIAAYVHPVEESGENTNEG